jgi:hypothetical protein
MFGDDLAALAILTPLFTPASQPADTARRQIA